MATYQVTGPDGHKYRVTGPDGATDEQVLGQIEAYSKRSPASTPEPAAPKRTAGESFGLGARDVLTGAGNIVNAPFEAVGGFAKGAAELAGFPKAGAAMNKAIVPPNLGAITSNAMGLPTPQGQREKTQSAIQQGVTEFAAPMMNAGTVNAARALPGAVRGAAEWAGKVPGRVSSAIEGHYGVPQAQQGALTAGRELVTGEASRLGSEAQTALATGQKAASTALSEAHSYEDLSTRLSRDLAEGSKTGGVPSIPKQGETLRGAMEGAYNAARDIRAAETAPLYENARTQALAREKDGARIDVSGVTADAEKQLEKSENIPELRANLQKQINTIKGLEGKPPVAAPIGKGKVASRIALPKTEVAPKTGLTYAELDQANRYLKDIAYSGELQGYDGISRKVALDLSHKLDAQIAKFVPEHAAAAAKYAELSEPLTTLTSRIGKAVTGSEGGMKGDAWSKIANEDLPGRLFGKRESVDQVVHALAGGEKATPKALATARKQVDQMVENWLLSSARGTAEAPRTGAAALDVLGKRPGTLEAVPKVGERLRGQFEREAGKEQTMAELAAGSKEARARAATATSKASTTAKPLQAEQARVADIVKTADELLKAGNSKEAMAKYTSAVRAGLANDQPKYQAALAWINRAEDAAMRAERAKKLAGYLAKGAAGAVGLEAAYQTGKRL